MFGSKHRIKELFQEATAIVQARGSDRVALEVVRSEGL